MNQEKIDEYSEQRPKQSIDGIDSEPKGEQKSQEEPINYYNQFCRLYLINTVLTTQLKELTSQKNELLTKLTRLQKRAEELSEGNTGQIDEKKRRIRRSASQIARHYKCQIQGCNKSYGSEGSLNQHLKLKHPQLFKSLNVFMPSHGIVKESYEQSQSD